MPGTESRRVGLAAIATLLVLGCQAPTQSLRLELEPADSRVYVDGDELAAGTRVVKLRSDRAHVVLVKRDGYRPQQWVIESRRVDGEPRLDPSQLTLRLEPLVPKEREIRIQGAD